MPQGPPPILADQLLAAGAAGLPVRQQCRAPAACNQTPSQVQSTQLQATHSNSVMKGNKGGPSWRYCVGGTGFEFCVFVIGSLRSEWPFHGVINDMLTNNSNALLMI